MTKNKLQVPENDPAEAFEKATAGVLFLDVREKHELEAEAYDVLNLLHIPLGELESRYKEIPRDSEVVIVCRGGGKSRQAVYFLMEHGYTNTMNMRLGIIGWLENGYPVKKLATSKKNDTVSCCDSVEGGCGTYCTPNTSTIFIGLDQLSTSFDKTK